MVTTNNYIFRPLTGHHQVVHTMKKFGGCTILFVQPDESLGCTRNEKDFGLYNIVCTT
jgi:hypothetical protein